MTKIDQTESTIVSEKHGLNKLARELAFNYFHNCSIDFAPNQYKGKINKLRKLEKLVFQSDILEKEEDERREAKSVGKEESDTPRHACRNILVIGAGATYNAFENVHLAPGAISYIQKKIIVAKVFQGIEIDDQSTRQKVKFQDLSFDYFIRFYQFLHPKVPQAFKLKKKRRKLKKQFDKKTLNAYMIKALGVDVKTHKHKSHLKKLVNKKDEGLGTNGEITALVELGKKYFDLYENLILYTNLKTQESSTVKDSKENSIDFETSLYLLSEVFSVSTIRTLVQEIYDVRYGPTLFYQVVAHLFKNSFIDVIINFNFDELLDQAISDEIEKDGYDMILSDGDCITFSEISDDHRLRQPLYIKPHGTASHKSTLRFTKNHYQELPQDMRSFLEEVIRAKTNNEVQLKVNLITVGFGMGSLEFNHIINNNLPNYSRIFHFYYNKYDRISEPEKWFDYPTESKRYIENIFDNHKKRKIQVIPLSHQYLTSVEIPELKTEMTTLGNTFFQLYRHIQEYYKTLFRPSDIHRHLIIAKLFGNQKSWRSFQNSSSEKERVDYPRRYFEKGPYFKDMVLVEILINLIANNGMIDPTLLMKGKTGHYYMLYSKFEKKRLAEQKKKSKETDGNGDGPISLAELIKSLDPRKENKNKEEINPLKITDFNIDDDDNFDSIIERLFDGNNLFSDEFKGYLTQYKKESKIRFKESIEKNFKAIKNSNNSKIQPKLRSAVHHTFSDYSWSDLVTNNLSYHLHFYEGIFGEKASANTICIVADYAHQLKHFLKNINDPQKNFNRINDIYVILAYPRYEDNHKKKQDNEIMLCEQVKENPRLAKIEAVKRLTGENLKNFKGKLHIRFRPIKRHNHHMTIFMNYDESLDFERHAKQNVSKVIYYYKKGLSESINPIRIKEEDNIENLLQKFKYYSDRAKSEFPLPEEKEWITD